MMYNTSKSPIKNVFLTLCLLNNTFNENLFYDKDLHELEQDQDVIDKSLANSKNTMNDIKKLPSLQIPVNWDRERYPSSILRFLLRKYPHRSTLGLNHQSQSHDFPVRNHGAKYAVHRTKLLDYDSELTTITMDTGSNEIGELNKINNETIVNQKNFFIILPETVKESARKNYSVALNRVVKGGKGAANMLSDIIKIKLNKTPAKVSTMPGIPQKVLDAIQNTTCPVYVIHEGTTLLVMPKNRAIDKRFTGTTTDKGTTTLNKMDFIKSEIPTSIMPSAISLFENVKNKSEIFVKTKAKKVTSTSKPKPQTQKVKIPSTSNTLDSRLRATTEKNKEKSPKTTSSSHNLTATILNTLDLLNKKPKQNTSVSTKAPKENTKIEMTILDTTCFPMLKIFDNYSSTLKVIMMNHSDDSIAKKTNEPFETNTNTFPNTISLPKTSQPTTLATTLQPTMKVNLTTAPEQSALCTIIVPCDLITTTKGKTMTTEQDLAAALNELNCEKNCGNKTTTNRNTLTTKQDLTAVGNECNCEKNCGHSTTTNRNKLTTEQDLTAVENECNCEKNCDHTTTTKRNKLTTEQDLAAVLEELNCENHDGGTTKNSKLTTEQDIAAVLNCEEVKPTTCKTLATKTCRQDEKTTRSCYKMKNQSFKESSSCPTKEPDQYKRCNIPRKQRLSTQMLHQNIFSPTHGKQRNISSLLVIKLISERPGSAFEDQVQKVTLVKSKHKF